MNYEIIVVGGGHAGIEAALAGARMGHKTALISMLAENIGATSCNPAIGGLAKGHLVKEIDALGGQMGLVTDEVGLQFRLLNESKGPAVRGSRAQIDMDRYRVVMRDICLNTPNLDVLQETVEELLIEEGHVRGVVTQLANRYEAPKVILTAGTFLDGTVHVGESQIKAGRFGEFAAIGLSGSMREAGLVLGRLKTGTCPRIDSSTIDYSVMEVQEGDANPAPFSFRTDKAVFAAKKQLPCYVTYTNATTHEIIESNFYRAPLFIGQIEGVGPRYCPSIEDKINRFADKERHHLFLEPQTAQHTEIYINGMSTSLPPDVQRDMVRSVRGMENARIVRYGYAIEYDYIDPTQLHHTLETKAIAGLYTAGQINGTTGYEEAAAQGLMAGINAALSLQGKAPLVLRRDEAYIGVLIDDLVTKGTKEPYRMFTSRAEYRLMLREENADVRLGHYGHALGLLSEAEFARVEAKKAAISQAMRLLEETIVTPHKAFLEELASMDEVHITEKMPLLMIAARKSFTLEKLLRLLPQLAHLEESILSEILVEAKYARYIEKQNEDLVRMKKWLHVPIPADFVYATIDGLSKEIVEKLNAIRPPNLDAASRISGVTPAAIEILQIFLKVQAKSHKV